MQQCHKCLLYCNAAIKNTDYVVKWSVNKNCCLEANSRLISELAGGKMLVIMYSLCVHTIVIYLSHLSTIISAAELWNNGIWWFNDLCAGYFSEVKAA